MSDKENSVDVIYVDNHLLVLNKPAGLLTQPTNISLDSLETRAKAWVKRKYKKPGRVFLECIHRLDKPVSGIVVFARTSKALSRMQKQMRE
ncbi:MAG: pseudouridine synthase, partial [Chlamydiota bacterium]